jgi:hypothetical protein
VALGEGVPVLDWTGVCVVSVAAGVDEASVEVVEVASIEVEDCTLGEDEGVVDGVSLITMGSVSVVKVDAATVEVPASVVEGDAAVVEVSVSVVEGDTAVVEVPVSVVEGDAVPVEVPVPVAKMELDSVVDSITGESSTDEDPVAVAEIGSDSVNSISGESEIVEDPVAVAEIGSDSVKSK